MGNLLSLLFTPPSGDRARKIEHSISLFILFFVLKHLSKKGIRKTIQDALKSVVGTAISVGRNLPVVSGVVEAELSAEVEKIEKKMLGDGDPNAILGLPETGWDHKRILETASALKDKDNFGTGQKWAGIYHEINGTCPLDELQSDLWKMFGSTNGLYPGIFGSCRKFEAEVIKMAMSLLHCPEGSCGLLSSGGTESILLAMLSYRELALSKGIPAGEAEIVCCRSAHPALDKAAHYFGLKLIKIDSDEDTLQFSPQKMMAAVGPNCVCIYLSAPCFAYGIVDPIEEIAPWAKKKNVGVHVDNCLGGFYLTQLQRAGILKRKFDFEVEGVTSISIDVHKYGFAPKGVSVIAYRSDELRRISFFPVTDGLSLYVTPTLQGSRGQGVTAAAWGTLLSMGQKGYYDAAVKLDGLMKKIMESVKEIQGIEVAGKPDLSIIPLRAVAPLAPNDIYKVSGQLERKGWSCFTSRSPALMQICVGEQHLRVFDQMVADLAESVKEVVQNPKMEMYGGGAVYGAATVLPDEVLAEVMKSYVDVTLKVKPSAKAEEEK